MVSFSCEVCNDTLLKKKLNGHFRQCPNAVFTCIDCSTTFEGNSFQQHTQCISEAEKYGMHKGVNKKNAEKKPAAENSQEQKPKEEEQPKPAQDGKDEAAKQARREERKQRKAEKKANKERQATIVKDGAVTKRGIHDMVSSGKPTEFSAVLHKWGKAFNLPKKKMLKKLTIEKNSNGELVLKM